MKTKLKQNNGFAIIGVLVLLLVLSLLGTAMYAYTISSLRSIRFASERKKAEYLAKSGVEVAAYAYQIAINEQDSKATGGSSYKKEYAEFISEMATLDQLASSTKVYLSWDKTNKKYVYSTTQPSSTSTNYDYIGYFTVTIQTKQLEFTNPLDTTDIIIGKAKQFVGTGVSGRTGAKARAAGFLPDSTVGSAEKFYTSYGYIQYPTSANIDNKDSFAPYSSMGETITVDIRRAFTTSLFTWLTGQSYFTLSNITIKPFAASSAGNFILDTPANSDTIKFYNGKGSYTPDSGFTFSPSGNNSNSIVFAAGDDIFLKAKLDVTPAKGSLNAISLAGNNIVIDGSIEMYVYCLPETSNQTLVRAILTTATKGYGLGKVIISTPVTTEKIKEATDTEPAEYGDPKPMIPYENINSGASFVGAGKIFFGGNVTVTVEIANEGKHRYRVFNAGDVYYFDANATIKTDVAANTEGNTQYEEDAAYGIDLLQYFLEKSISENKYSEKTLNRFRTILKFYYSTDAGTNVTYSNHYIVGTDDPMSIIPKNQVTRYNELVPPTPFDASNINWDVLSNVSAD